MVKERVTSIEHLDQIKHSYLDKNKNYKARVLVCGGAGCISSDCLAVKESLEASLEEHGLTEDVFVGVTGCMGICAVGPVLLVDPGEIFYVEITPDKVDKIVQQHLVDGDAVEEYTFYDKELGEYIPKLSDITFFKDQVRIALRNCGLMEYDSLAAYVSRDGYRGFAKAIEKTPQEVVDVVKDSGLRGRGGAGFPTGIKLQSGLSAAGDEKYLVCNADEGDPGAFMDRSLLEGDPHSIIEGMLIGGYAIGANKGFIYVRAEYPIAVQRMEAALEQAREVGLLGENILGSGFDFDLEIRIGAGAFVCGEETALLASIEGQRGEPRQKPPFPFESGLFDRPTIINNVETLSNLAPILNRGADWYRSIGTEKSAGTKVFALAGDIENTGIIEVPMGMILGDIIYKIGGGIRDGKEFKAIQSGGPSGGCLTAQHLNVPVDYESLAELGAIMGSGGLVVMDQNTCMVDTARYFLDFICDESCGKCLPCRVGTQRMLEILEKITKGEGELEDLEILEDLAATLQQSAMCGLGQTAANPVLSTLQYFRDEYETHIISDHCTAGVCADLQTSPCRNACPANVHVPGYLSLVVAGEMQKAYQLIRQDNPFPAVCGRICTHPCELHCRRSQVDEAIAIRDIKRYISDYTFADDYNFPLTPALEATGQRVAIVGAGPSGLSCAHYLVQLGHEVDVYEAEDVAGGILHWGIPEFRLPEEILEKEINIIRDEGVNIYTGVRVGKDKAFEELENDYDAVYIAIGTQAPRKPGIPGENLEGAESGLGLLKRLSLGTDLRVPEKLVVIGGGSTAMDAARAALRGGCEDVTVVYRRSRKQMPATHEEIRDALEEGIHLVPLAAPVEIVEKDGKVAGVKVIQQEFSNYGSDGRRNVRSVPGSEYIIDCDGVAFAINQEIEDIFADDKEEMIINRFTSATNDYGVFAGGDASPWGENVIINAIADGKQAAINIDKFLGGTGVLNVGEEIEIPIIEEMPDQDPHPRYPTKQLPVDQRLGNHKEVELGYHGLDALAESLRCLHCDRR